MHRPHLLWPGLHGGMFFDYPLDLVWSVASLQLPNVFGNRGFYGFGSHIVWGANKLGC